MLLKSIRERRRQQDRADNRRAGRIAAMIFNVHRSRGARALSEDDIFPERRSGPITLTWDDFSHLKDRMGPTLSIRSKVAEA